LKEKAAREAGGLECFKKDFAVMPGIVRILEQYETQEVKEARFVRIVDKWMPVLVHFGDKGQTVRSYTVADRLVEDYLPHARRFKKQFPDFPELVSVREELTELVAKHLF
jgi:hypothetical protein